MSRGHDESRAFKDATHVIVDESVTVIKRNAFHDCKHLVSLIMGDNVKRIEGYAFTDCRALRFVRMSKALEISVVVNLWRFCSSHRQSNRLEIRHSVLVDQ